MTPQERQVLVDLVKQNPGAVVARIKPGCGRRKQIVGQRCFHVEAGWAGPVPPGLQKLMEGCVVNEMNPASECVFQITTARNALALEERQEAAERRGRPLALPDPIDGEQPASVDELVDKLVAKKLGGVVEAALADMEKRWGDTMAAKLDAARKEGAAAERQRAKDKAAVRRPTKPAEAKAEPPPPAKAAPPAAETAPTQ